MGGMTLSFSDCPIRIVRNILLIENEEQDHVTVRQ